MTYWGHRATVAPPAEIVFTFEGSFGIAFGQPSVVRGALVDHPVDPGLRSGRVGIVADKRNFPRSLGQAGPVQGWGYVLPLTRVLRWDDASLLEGGTRHLNGHGEKIPHVPHRTYRGANTFGAIL